jgi:hypothetical protein
MREGRRQLWSPEQDNQLRELMKVGASITLIVAKLKRSREAVRMRCIILRKRSETRSEPRAPPAP